MKVGTLLAIFFDVNLTSSFPLEPPILYCVNVEPTSVLELFCDLSNLGWEPLFLIPVHPQTKTTKRPEYAVNPNLPVSIQADINFRHSLSP